MAFVTMEKHLEELSGQRDREDKIVAAGNELLRAVHALAISDKEGHARAWAQIDAAKQKWMNAR